MNEKPSGRNELHTVIFDQLSSPKTAGHKIGHLSFKQGDLPLTDPNTKLYTISSIYAHYVVMQKSYLNGIELFTFIIEAMRLTTFKREVTVKVLLNHECTGKFKYRSQ